MYVCIHIYIYIYTNDQARMMACSVRRGSRPLDTAADRVRVASQAAQSKASVACYLRLTTLRGIRVARIGI